ncbi:MAG: FkbM family methyltransferase [Minisyncoccia bacterium]
MWSAIKKGIYKLLNRPWPIALTYNGRTLWGWKPLSLFKPHETETARFFEKYIRPGMRVADVGANVGWYTLMFSDLVGSEGMVHAYEPDPRSFSRLEKGAKYHLKKRRRANILLHQEAVTDEEREVKLYGSLGSGRNSTARSEQGGVVASVQGVLLPPDIDIAKIDVEGGELDVLQGSRPKAATVEYSFTLLDREVGAGEVYLAAIRALGYEIFSIDPHGTIHPLIGTPTGQGHINLFVRRVEASV